MKVEHVSVRDAIFGDRAVIVEPVNIYECELGNDVFVGPFVEIQKGVKIGNNVRIQSHTFICELVTINNNVFIGHGVIFINDDFHGGNRAHGNPGKLNKTIIGNDVLIGSNATILPVQICDNVTIGAGSVVTKDICKPGIYAGNPAKLIGKGFADG